MRRRLRRLQPSIVQAAMVLATMTGLRPGDLLGLRLQDWATEGLHCRTAKTGKALLFSRTPELEAAVQAARAVERRAASMYLLATQDGQKYSVSGFSSIWQRVMGKAVKAGVERFQFRDLRAKAGSDHDTGRILGHLSDATTRRIYRRRPELVTPVRLKILDGE